MVDPDLKDAVLQVLDEYARRDPQATIHSDLIIRKFPQVNELELINAIGELLEAGKITAKASTLDAHGNATAFHIRVRGIEGRPPGLSEPPRGGPGQFSVGFGGTEAASSRRETEEPPPPRKVGLTIKDDKIDLKVGDGRVREQPRPPSDEKKDRLTVSVGGAKDAHASMQEEAEQNFADEAASFFAELSAHPARDEEAKNLLIDQLTVLMGMFQSTEVASFTTPLAKLAALKERVKHIAPDLVPDYILLMQTALRAWLGRV